MLKYSIDFSIFASPTEAYGNVTGELEFARVPEIGDKLRLFDGLEPAIDSLIPHQDTFRVGVEDIVFGSRREAQQCGRARVASRGMARCQSLSAPDNTYCLSKQQQRRLRHSKRLLSARSSASRSPSPSLKPPTAWPGLELVRHWK